MGEASNAQNAAKTMIENIMDEVISITGKQTDSCPTPLDDSKFQTYPSKDTPDPVFAGLKEGILEHVLDEHESFSLHPRLSERFCLSLTNLPEVWEHGSTLSTSTSQQGEGDVQQQSMLEAATFYQMELLNQEGPALSRDQNRKSLSMSSLSTDVSQNKVLEYLETSLQNLTFDGVQLNRNTESSVDESLESSLQNLTFDTVQFTRNTDSRDDDDDHFTEHELVDDEKNFPSESTSPKEHTESLLLSTTNSQQYFGGNWNDAEESSDSSEYISDSKNSFLQNSQKFYQHNKVQYFPASFEQLPDNYCELVDASYDRYQMETKYNEETEEVISESSKELVNVKSDTEMVDSMKNLPPTNPFRYPHVQPSAIDLPSTSDSSSPQIHFKESTTGIRPHEKDSNFEEANEVQIKVTEPENFIDIEENMEEDDVDIIQSREYWSNTGLMTEHKINPKYLGPLPDITGIESIKGVLSVKETCLEQNVEKDPLLSIPLKSDENNAMMESHDHNDNAGENFLSYPRKAENKKRKQTVITRLTNTISHIFRSKKNYNVENKK